MFKTTNYKHQIPKKSQTTIEEQLAAQDNSDIASVVDFHTKHGIRDVEQRIADNEKTDLECPYGSPDELKRNMNKQLLNLELCLLYYYRDCYFASAEEQKCSRKKIMDLLKYEP